ncbi:WxL domain-containing protein [Loigolactobacillus zhaoyuanensis]|uniref:WxL domain-containing protein n=1 Tax=Loigolactobacillus zhaoyuanensis TaxID=2486017 RepID=A0ABW8UIW8_9LACO
MLCMATAMLACFVAPQTANAAVIDGNSSMWSSWQTNPKMTNPGGIYKMTGTTISEGSYNYQFTYTGHLSDLVGFVAGTTSPALSKLSSYFFLPNINLAKGQSNYDSSVVPQVTVADGTNVSTSSKANNVGLDDNTLNAANYSTRVEFNSGVMSAFNPGLSKLNDIITITLKVKLSQPSDAGTAQVKINNSQAVIPIVSKAFYKDDVTGADLAPATSFGAASTPLNEDGLLGAPVKIATALPITSYGGTEYRYDHYQKIVKTGSSANIMTGGSATSIAGIVSVDSTLKLWNSYVFWYEPKDPAINVVYFNEDTNTTIKTGTAWGYNLGHVYKKGTTAETTANLLTAPATLTSGNKMLQYDSYDYIGNLSDENSAQKNGTDLTKLTLDGVASKQDDGQLITLNYKAATKTNVGVHYWNIDQQSTTVPTGSAMAADTTGTRPTGLDFTQLTGNKDAVITGNTTDPIDVDGSGGVAAAKAPTGWYYVGYQYNDGSGVNKWVAYDPKTPSTSRFIGNFSDKDKGVSFMYRQNSALALLLPDTLDFGTVLPGMTSTNLQATTGTTDNPNGLMVKVQDNRATTAPTNQWVDPWHVTVAGSTLTGDSTGQVADTAIKLSNGSAEGSGQLATAINIPLDSQTIVPVLDNTTLGGMTDTIASWQYANVTLDVPAGHVMGPDTYHSILTWTLTSGY